MSRFEHGRVMQILADAMELPRASRGSYLDSTCMGDADLRRHVEDLLECTEPAVEVFDAASRELPRADPDQIGGYTLLEPLGEGGMAIVYRAQQHRPVRRIVALKLIRLGMDTRQVIARFETERQALAMMDHPNVARVHDAGSTASGRPYFVMEYVPGRPILDYCDEHELNVAQRLELFIAVCEAVEHAHRKGIIHRDIKNSNVLVMDVDGRAVPKVIDFGVAKAIQQPLTDRTLQTEQGQLIGTPEYMSPEAARGTIDIDTRSDIYSLGVLLYELIAGVLPIPSEMLRSGGFAQVAGIIRDFEPSPPSTRLGTLGADQGSRVASRRGTALPTLLRELRSELEWIPLKAMRKDRELRYGSASELADDVRNYLAGRPLLAGPESGWYRAQKFLRRHKGGVAASAAIVFLLLAGIIATSLQAIRATRAERRADRKAVEAHTQASIAQSVNELMTQMIAKANRGQQKGDPNITVRAVMDAAAAELNASQTSHAPEVEAALRAAIGQTYLQLGLYDTAEPLLRQALEQRIAIGGARTLLVATSQCELALLLSRKGNYVEAEQLCRQALATRRQIRGDEHPDVAHALSGLGFLLWTKGDYDAAEPPFREALAMRRKLLGDEHPDVAYSLNNLAALLHLKGDFNAAELMYREALAMRRKLRGNEHVEVATTLTNLANVLTRKGDYAAAEVPAREALTMRRKLQGDAHPDVATAMNNLAGVLLEKGDHAAAAPLFREALEVRRTALGADHPDTIMCMSNLGAVLRSLREYAQAEPIVREALDRCRRVCGDDHPYTFAVIRNLGLLLVEQGRLAEAEPLYAELYRRVPAAKVDRPTAARYLSLHGPCLVKLGRYDDAEPPLRDAYERLKAAGLTRDAQMRAVVDALAELCDHTGRPQEAAQWRGELASAQVTADPAGTPATTRPQ